MRLRRVHLCLRREECYLSTDYDLTHFFATLYNILTEYTQGAALQLGSLRSTQSVLWQLQPLLSS